MAHNKDPFDIVKEWWNTTGGKVESDTKKLGINLSTKEGAFECLILGILYSIEGTGPDIKNTFYALRKDGYTKIALLSRISRASGHLKDLEKMRQIFEANYFGGRLAIYVRKGKRAGKIIQITGNANVVDQKLDGDIGKLHQLYGGDGCKMLQWLWKLDGIKKKTFWMMREMRMNHVWDVDGRYCCVPDKQVGSSLKRWGKIKKWPSSPSFNLCLKCSQIVWNYFGDLYDLPILHYAREFKCNDSRSRRCTQCKITACEDRPVAIVDS